MKVKFSILLILISNLHFIYGQKPEMFIPTGHSEPVTEIRFSPNGQFVLSAGGSILKLWNINSGKVIKTFSGHSGLVTSLCFSNDGKLIYSSSIDMTVKVWDIATGLEKNSIEIETPSKLPAFVKDSYFGITSLDISKNNEYILLGCEKLRSITLIDIKSGKEIESNKNLPGYIHDISLSNCGTKYLASMGNTVSIWDIKTGSITNSFNICDQDIRTATFSPDGKLILIVNENWQSILWDIEDGVELLKLNEEGNSMVCFSQNSNFLLTGDYFGDLNLLSIEPDSLTKALPISSIGLKSIGFSPNAKHLALGHEDGKIEIWNLDSVNLVRTFSSYPFSNHKVESVKFSPCGDFIITSLSNNTIKHWDLKFGSNTKTIVNKSKYGKILSVSPDCSHLLASENGFGPITLIDLNKNQSIGYFDYDDMCVTMSICFSPDGEYFLSGDGLNSVAMWDIEKRKLINLFQSHELSFLFNFSVDISQDGNFALSASDIGLIKIWDLQESKLIQSFSCDTTILNNVYFSPDGTNILTCNSIEDQISFWDLKTGGLIRKIETDIPDLNNAIYSPDGNSVLYYGYSNNTPILLDLNTLETISFEGHTKSITTASFSPTGNNITTGSKDGTMRMWNTNNGDEIAKFICIDDDWIILTPDNYYYCSDDALTKIQYRVNNYDIYDFDQFDLQFNRPDIVMERIGVANSLTIEMYRQAYYKRLKKMNIDESMFSSEFHTPEIKIDKKDRLKSIVDTKSLSINILATDSKYNINRINIWNNGIPVFGTNGIDVRNHLTSNIYKAIGIDLSIGNNIIQVSCLNEQGVESLKETIEITYNPKKKSKPDLYIVAISASEYIDKTMNLKFAVKDGRDIVSLFSANDNWKNIFIDTLFNEQATKENILQIKEKLYQSNVDDQIILFISGHGLLDQNHDFYFATYDIEFENPTERGVSYNDLDWLLDSIPARKKLFMMDACHSGEADKEELIAFDDLKKKEGLKKGIKSYSYRAKILEGDTDNRIGLQNSFEVMQEAFTNLDKGSGSVVISAAAGNSYALESDEWNNGVFTYSVINGLKNGYADINTDGEITVSELRDYVCNNVLEETGNRQKPTIRQGNVHFDYSIFEPNEYITLTSKGFNYLNHEQYDLAIESYLKTLDIKTDNPKVYYFLGIANYKLKEYDNAKQYFQQVIILDNKNDSAFFELGNVCHKLRQYNKAIDAYSKAIEINKNSIQTYYKLGWLFEYLGENEKAINAFTLAAEINPDQASAYYKLGELYDRIQEYEKAVESYLKVTELNTYDPFTYSRIGNSYMKLHKYDHALEAYLMDFKIDSLDEYTCKKIGSIYYSLGQFELALNFSQKALEIITSQWEIMKNLPNSEYFEQYKNTIEGYSKSIEFGSNDSTANIILEKAYYNLGVFYSISARNEKATVSFLKAIEYNPSNAEAFYSLGDTYFQLGHYDVSIESYKKAISLESNDPSKYYNLGNAYTRIEKYSNAIEEYQNSIQLNSNDPYAYYTLGNAYEELGEYEKAIVAFQNTIALKPNHRNAYAKLGNIYYFNNQFDKAILAYLTANELKIVNPGEEYFYLGNCYFLLEQYDKAILVYPEAIRYNQNNVSAYCNLGRAYYKCGLSNKAIESYQKAIELEPNNIIALTNLGIAYNYIKQYINAIKTFLKVIEIDSNDAIAIYHLANVYYELGQFDNATGLYQKLIEIRSDFSYGFYKLGRSCYNIELYESALEAYLKYIKLEPEKAFPYYYVGLTYNRLGRYDMAIEAFLKFIEYEPDDAYSFYHLGIAYSNLEQYDKAIFSYHKAIEIKPDNSSFYYDLGITHYDTKQYNKAVESFLYAIELRPDYRDYYVNLGYSYLGLKKYQLALVSFEKTIELVPDNPWNYYNIMCFYSLQNSIDKAIEWFEKALIKGFDNWDHLANDSDIDNIRKTERYQALINKYKNQN